jgi:linoleoyl-CoA desaturase
MNATNTPQPQEQPARPHIWASEAERLQAFGQAIDQIGKRARAEVGREDLDHIRGVRRWSRRFEIAGRGLIMLAPEPLSYAGGVLSLWLHKQLEATEIGHTALHGAFNRIDGAGEFASAGFRWRTPIDEDAWRRGHNGRHHGHTNVAGHDPDIHFGFVRLTPETPHRPINYLQVPASLLLIWPNFTFMMNAHFTGLIDVYFGNGRDDRHDFIPDRSWASILAAHRQAFRKYLPYYAREYLLFPALAGPWFAKVALGNWLSETMRDIYSAATIYCGHVGTETKSYAEGEQATSRGQRYAMQVEASNNFDVPLPLSILCGALDRQIEHHLFPSLPTNRLREIAPEVRAVCEQHGVQYRSASWPRTLWSAFKQLARLSVKGPSEQVPHATKSATEASSHKPAPTCDDVAA